MTNNEQMTNTEVADVISALLTDGTPLYEVYPIRGEGASIVAARFSEVRYTSSQIIFTWKERKEQPPQEELGVTAILEAFDRVRSVVHDEVDLIDVLDKLETVRAAAERQRLRYAASHRANERLHEEASAAGVSPTEIEDYIYDDAHEIMSGLVHTLALRAACNFVEAWYLETSELPGADEAKGAVSEPPYWTKGGGMHVKTLSLIVEEMRQRLKDGNKPQSFQDDVCKSVAAKYAELKGAGSEVSANAIFKRAERALSILEQDLYDDEITCRLTPDVWFDKEHLDTIEEKIKLWKKEAGLSH